MKVTLNIEKRYAYSIAGLLILVIGAIAVNASMPTNFVGHDASKVWVNAFDKSLEDSISQGDIGGGLGVDFQWVLSSEGCKTGYIDTGLRDDSDDGIHDLNEINKNGDEQMLCVKGVEAITWAASCPSGYISTEISDFETTNHLLSKSSGSCVSSTIYFCIKGISEIEWAGNCAQGWVDAHITDDNREEFRCLNERTIGVDSDAGGMHLCVLP
ncbi:hypothetical protein KAR91_65310 [Candidatus Pacearchaeota archaeon]|nr:hypothetical protein [Candidatus Pacearchaeota archaeon]